jgi:hypothetical protein
MIPQENYNTYHKEDGIYHMEEAVQPEIMESNHPIANQHCSEERSADHQPTELDRDDADRRTLDESQADEDDKD